MPLSPGCRIVLVNIKEDEIRDENGFDIFEPDVSLEVAGRRAFELFGQPHVPVVIMHAREEWIKQTRNMVRQIDFGVKESEYPYYLYGTLNSMVAVRRGEEIEVVVEWGEFQRRSVGIVPPREWIRAVVDVSRELSDLFRRLHPSLFKDPLFVQQELWLQEIESWLIADAATDLGRSDH